MDARERYAVAKATSVALSEASHTVEDVQQELIGQVKRSRLGRLPLTSGVLSTMARGTHAIHQGIRAMAWIGSDVVAPALHATAPPDANRIAEGERGAAYVAAISCAFGDHLGNSHETVALTTPMNWFSEGRPITAADLASEASDDPDSPQPNSTLCIFLHGLGHTESNWGPEMIEAAEQSGAKALFARYNTGRSISDNGHALAELLHELEALWPAPIQRIILVGHSMGALVARSACQHTSGTSVHHRITDLLSLGAPHRGSPVEKIASYALHGLASLAPTAPIARIGNRRSVGIKDLRHGAVHPWDWNERHPDDVLDDTTTTHPLPPHINHQAFAATLSPNPDSLKAWILGDGIVRANSARPLREVARGEKVTITTLPASGHISLLNHPVIIDTLRITTERPGHNAGKEHW